MGAVRQLHEKNFVFGLDLLEISLNAGQIEVSSTLGDLRELVGEVQNLISDIAEFRNLLSESLILLMDGHE